MLTSQQLENIQIDYGLIYLDYGETSQQQLGPTKGGGEFSAEMTLRNIEFDGARGRTKGMQVIDEINAVLKTSIMDTSLATLGKLLPQLKLVTPTEGSPYLANAQTGVIPDERYLKNVTMFAKVKGGGYKRITLYNAMAENNMGINAAPKAEGVVALEIYAHWEASGEAATDKLFKVEDVAAIA